MSNFFKIKKASENEIYTSLSNKQISITSDILKQYVRKDDDPIDGLIDFTPNDESYIKWTIRVVDAGIGQARLEVKILDIQIKGNIEYEIENSYEPIIIENIVLPINEINVDINFSTNLIAIDYIDYNENGNINVNFSSLNE